MKWMMNIKNPTIFKIQISKFGYISHTRFQKCLNIRIAELFMVLLVIDPKGCSQELNWMSKQDGKPWTEEMSDRCVNEEGVREGVLHVERLSESSQNGSAQADSEKPDSEVWRAEGTIWRKERIDNEPTHGEQKDMPCHSDLAANSEEESCGELQSRTEQCSDLIGTVPYDVWAIIFSNVSPTCL